MSLTLKKVRIALTSLPVTYFFFELVRLGRNAVGSRIQLPPWLETQSHTHNRNLWPDAQLHLGENESQCAAYYLNILQLSSSTFVIQLTSYANEQNIALCQFLHHW